MEVSTDKPGAMVETVLEETKSHGEDVGGVRMGDGEDVDGEPMDEDENVDGEPMMEDDEESNGDPMEEDNGYEPPPPDLPPDGDDSKASSQPARGRESRLLSLTKRPLEAIHVS